MVKNPEPVNPINYTVCLEIGYEKETAIATRWGGGFWYRSSQVIANEPKFVSGGLDLVGWASQVSRGALKTTPVLRMVTLEKMAPRQILDTVKNHDVLKVL